MYIILAVLLYLRMISYYSLIHILRQYTSMYIHLYMNMYHNYLSILMILFKLNYYNLLHILIILVSRYILLNNYMLLNLFDFLHLVSIYNLSYILMLLSSNNMLLCIGRKILGLLLNHCCIGLMSSLLCKFLMYYSIDIQFYKYKHRQYWQLIQYYQLNQYN